ncbi:zinc finger c2h2 superfamily [Holotrichia oblita]|uniref:Zinc finger c2h2 superfamily n=1 Tax=Holotrichia oblita TaxID=644536 RepID=A0ACB9TNN6_HOLOL|nr:zinc finger c2h2 superfamily [Holotrichia oblita]
MAVCGPKLSLCGLILSVWGILQLTLMGVFYYIRSVALAEDVPGLEEHFESLEEFYAAADAGYTQVYINYLIKFYQATHNQISRMRTIAGLQRAFT